MFTVLRHGAAFPRALLTVCPPLFATGVLPPRAPVLSVPAPAVVFAGGARPRGSERASEPSDRERRQGPHHTHRRSTR